MKAILCKAPAMLLVLLMLLASLAFPVSAAEETALVEASIPFRVAYSGSRTDLGEQYTVTLKPDDAGFSMPASASMTISGLDADVPGNSGAFRIQYAAPGVYTYTLTQARGKDASAVYDQRVYTVAVTVENHGGGFRVTVAIRNPAGKKCDAASFLNKYPQETPPPSGEEITVRKVWAGSGKKHPSSVTVQLTDNGRVAETVTLGDWNNWTHTWKKSGSSHSWEVR